MTELPLICNSLVSGNDFVKGSTPEAQHTIVAVANDTVVKCYACNASSSAESTLMTQVTADIVYCPWLYLLLVCLVGVVHMVLLQCSLHWSPCGSCMKFAALVLMFKALSARQSRVWA